MSDNPWDLVIGILSDIPEEEFEAMVNESGIKEFDGYQFVGKMTDETPDDVYIICPTRGEELITLDKLRTEYRGDAWVDGYLYAYKQLGGPVYKKVKKCPN